MSIKKNVIIPASVVALICAVLLLAINLLIHYDQQRYSTSVENRIESENDPHSEEERIVELENEIRDLRRQLNERENEGPSASQSRNVTPETNSDSYDILRGLLDTSPRQLNAEITSRESRTDANFNRYTVLTVKNNYPKTIRSLRIGSRLMDEADRPNTPAWRNYGKEVIQVVISPGQAKTVAVRNITGFPQDFYIDAVNFTDGTSIQ